MIAIYTRVSTGQQSTDRQVIEIEAYLKRVGLTIDGVKWLSDSATGKSMDRPGMNALIDGIESRKFDTVIIWSLDRLGRTVSGLSKFFDLCKQKGVTLVSLKENIDLSKASGRLLVDILVSIAAYETELRGERVKSGQALARSRGVKWGGRQKGYVFDETIEKLKIARELRSTGFRMATIAKKLMISKQAVSKLLRRPV